ncbi:MAG: prepilin-type N-terminal cleavage/methylation domain-containing protein [Desulforhopalus sp.]|nr:prepilin-type N-terminal cleavage/methylation domain-containing protein [Desulforhopalus sp.]
MKLKPNKAGLSRQTAQTTIMPLRYKEGFTLLEVLLAMVILTVGILALFGMQIGAIRGNSLANDITDASTRALDEVEQILAMSPDDVATRSNNAAINTVYAGVGAGGANITADSVEISGNYTIYVDGTPVLYPEIGGEQVGMRFEVCVVWPEGGVIKQVSLLINRTMRRA